MDKWSRPQWNVGLIYVSTPKLQLNNRWSLGMDKSIYPTTLLGMWLRIHAGIKVKPGK